MIAHKQSNFALSSRLWRATIEVLVGTRHYMMTTPLITEPEGSQAEFWSNRWETGTTPWDLGGVPTALVSFLARTKARTRVLIPGCGSGYEVRAFHEAGFDVTAIEFCAPAVARAREVLGPLGNNVIHGDFFKHDFGENRFGLIYERGFLCSLPPVRWPTYASRVANLLVEGGSLVGLFLYGQEPEPPPYPMSQESAAGLLGPLFRLAHSEAVSESVPVYRGLEHWQEWQRFRSSSSRGGFGQIP